MSNKTFLAATAEHPFFTNGQWIEAKDMKGKTISIIDMALDEISEQILLGTMLGDAFIYKFSSDTGILKMVHGEAQKEYLSNFIQ